MNMQDHELSNQETQGPPVYMSKKSSEKLK